ncbi:hypothetical protein LINPERPRIM_LOCUS18896 [Linum perenne]|jgi:hypothetical protein
MVHLI